MQSLTPIRSEFISFLFFSCCSFDVDFNENARKKQIRKWAFVCGVCQKKNILEIHKTFFLFLRFASLHLKSAHLMDVHSQSSARAQSQMLNKAKRNSHSRTIARDN
jgi:hypothetical protein